MALKTAPTWVYSILYSHNTFCLLLYTITTLLTTFLCFFAVVEQMRGKRFLRLLHERMYVVDAFSKPSISTIVKSIPRASCYQHARARSSNSSIPKYAFAIGVRSDPSATSLPVELGTSTSDHHVDRSVPGSVPTLCALAPCVEKWHVDTVHEKMLSFLSSQKMRVRPKPRIYTNNDGTVRMIFNCHRGPTFSQTYIREHFPPRIIANKQRSGMKRVGCPCFLKLVYPKGATIINPFTNEMIRNKMSNTAAHAQQVVVDDTIKHVGSGDAISDDCSAPSAPSCHGNPLPPSAPVPCPMDPGSSNAVTTKPTASSLHEVIVELVNAHKNHVPGDEQDTAFSPVQQVLPS